MNKVAGSDPPMPAVKLSHHLTLVSGRALLDTLAEQNAVEAHGAALTLIDEACRACWRANTYAESAERRIAEAAADRRAAKRMQAVALLALAAQIVLTLCR